MTWIERVVCCYRLHGTNMIRDAVSQTKSCVAMLDKFFANVSAIDKITHLKPRAYGRIYASGSACEYGSGQIEQAKVDLTQAIQINPSLLDNREEYILDIFIGWAWNPIMGPDPFAYLNLVFDNLPESVSQLRNRRKVAMARAAMARFFEAYQQDDRRTVRQMFLTMLKHDPSWLHNRGVISIFMQSLLGIQMMQWVRNLSLKMSNWLHLVDRVPSQ
jgi:hypothetical protein